MARDSKGFEDYSYPEWKSPEQTPARMQDVRRAAELYASANLSDPFAFHRIICHMNRGFIFPSDVIAEAQSQLTARSYARLPRDVAQ